ncbi:MAG TPA: hypothetical protein VII58_06465 [Acidobacteriaceae bacterium]
MAPSPALRRVIQTAALCAGAGAMLCGVAMLGAGSASAQQLIGYVKADDADVTGATDVLDGQAVLSGSVGVTAKSHTAVITLGRGGLARVCQTSALHMTQSKAAGTTTSGTAPLLFSLDRGAVEIRMNGLASDSIMTPDLRMTVQTNGPLDVRLRVARNGDTCVENHGAAAPALAVSDPFGTSMYELMAGQHVLFEHGDLHQVVDHETESCGCPDEPGATVAEALLAPGGQKLGKAATPATSVELHPFPAAVSEGLAPAAPSQVEANPAQPQATTALSYSAPADALATVQNGVATTAGARAGSSAPAPVAVAAMPAAATPASLGAVQPVKREPGSKPASPRTSDADQSRPNSPNRDLVHMIGHFFRKIFGH